MSATRRERARARRLVAALLVLVAGCGDAGPSSESGEARRPNLVVLLSDDQDYEHFGFLGFERAHTPALDRMAEEGVLFTSAHVAASRCRPSQAALLTGQWPHVSGVTGSVGPGRSDMTRSLAHLLRQGGYATFGGGKWWQGHPRDGGFQRHAFGNPEDHDTNLRFVREDQQGLADFVDEFAGRKPLFVWWAPVLPHTPHRPPERYQELVDRAAIPIPPWYTGDVKEYRMREFRSLAMGAWLDAGIAEARAILEAAGELENTLFVFLVDNGWSVGLVAKGSPFEKGVRTPVVFSWPGHLAPARHDTPITALDVYPTLLDFAGVPVPEGTAGRSLRPVLEGREEPRTGPLCGAAYVWNSMHDEPRPAEEAFALYARDERWKYVLYLRDLTAEDYDRTGMGLEVAAERVGLRVVLGEPVVRRRGHEDLYDLRADPLELNDLSAELDLAPERDRLRAAALDWWRSTGGDPLALPDED